MINRLAQLIAMTILIANQTVFADDNMSVAEQQEYQVKALFLYNFANFVEWPSNAFSSEEQSIRLCLFGDVPFGVFLDEVDGTLIGDRELAVQRATNVADISEGCHILFVGDEKRVLLPEFWNEIKYLYVLSVGEESQFTQRGGIINILRTTDQVQFEVNITNAIANGLFISSDLLALARQIRENTETGNR